MAKSRSTFTGMQLTVMVILRFATGWLILYEGIGRTMNSSWSIVSYLSASRGFFSEYFKSLIVHANLMYALGFVSEWGMILIGMGLVFGLFLRFFSFSGLVFTLIGYLSHPPFLGISYVPVIQGSYLVVNELFILFFLFLVFILFPTSYAIVIDRLIFGKK